MDTDQDLEELIRDLSVEITLVYRWLAESVGINYTDLMCLYVVRKAGGTATPKMVSQRLGLTTGATAIMLNRLETAGFLVRSPHPTDRRGVILSIGGEVQTSGLLTLRETFSQLNSEVFSSFSPAELVVVRRFMKLLLGNTRQALQLAREARE